MFFFAKKDPPGVDSKVRGGFKKKKKKNGITQRFYVHFGQIFWGGETQGGGDSEDITVCAR